MSGELPPELGSTGIGSMPGTSPKHALALVFGEGLSIPFLPELPGRGPGADLIGRAAARLVDLPIELASGRWRLAGRPGMDQRRANDFWERDLDALEAAASGLSGPLKISLAGPWTLAATLELRGGSVVVTDAGAVRELAASLAEGTRELLRDIQARLPHADLIVQYDEPSLRAVLDGALPSASRFSRINPVAESTVEETLRTSIAALNDVPVAVHSCAPSVPVLLLRRAGAQAALIDAALVTDREYDALAEAVDQGLRLVLGVLPTTSTASPQLIDQATKRAREIASGVGISPHDRARTLGISPACGLAGGNDKQAIGLLAAAKTVASRLSD